MMQVIVPDFLSEELGLDGGGILLVFLFRYLFQFFILTFIVLNFIITVVKNPRLWPFQQQQQYFNTQNTAKDMIERVGGMVNLDQQMRSDITCYYFISFFQFSILAIMALHCIITLIKNLGIWPKLLQYSKLPIMSDLCRFNYK